MLLPVLGGAFLNQYFQSLVKFVSPLMPPIAVGTVAILCGNAIAQSASSILSSGPQVALAAFLLHASGFFFGYVLSRMLGLDVASCRTISIEVGMQVIIIIKSTICEDPTQHSRSIIQHRRAYNCLIYTSLFYVILIKSSLINNSFIMFQNSVLGVVLATQHFGNPLTAVPCAVSSVCHSIFGSVLAGIWRRTIPKQKKD